MGSSARPLHDAGNDRTLERRSLRKVACRGCLTIRPNPPETYERPRALTPSPGARSMRRLFLGLVTLAALVGMAASVSGQTIGVVLMHGNTDSPNGTIAP